MIMLAGKLEPKLKMNINIVSIKSINSVWIPSIGGTKLIRKVGDLNNFFQPQTDYDIKIFF